MATYSSILAWKIHGQGKLEGSSPRGHKELDTTSLPLTLQQPLSEASWAPLSLESVYSISSPCKCGQVKFSGVSSFL